MRRRQMMARKPVQPQRSTDEDLKAQFQAKFGKPPHWKMKRETIVERLNDTGNVSA